MNKLIEIKEYDSLVCNKDYDGVDKFTYIAERDFKNLEIFIREYTGVDDNVDALDFMHLGFRRGVGDVISFRNYVGLIQLKNGFQVQVLPKIEIRSENDEGNETTKRIFLRMLRCMKDFPSKVFNDASLKVDHMNLYEIFINMYVQETRQLVKHGLRSSYVSKEENLKFYKGKLMVDQHIRTNLAHKERFFVGFEDFHLNRPENRLVKATLEKLQKITSSAENAKEIRQLLLSFEVVESSVAYEKDFSKVIINRNTKDYENLMKWSRVFLMNDSFTTFSGTTTSRALLFPMESVYESFVAKQLRKVFVSRGWSVSCQDHGHYLFEEPRKQFALRPDIVIEKAGRRIVLDTKWKNLIDNERKNYGISQDDMYQMYAYSKKYNTPEIWLLYPENRVMREHEPIIFYSGDNTIVRLHFVDLERIETSMEQLEKQIDMSV